MSTIATLEGTLGGGKVSQTASTPSLWGTLGPWYTAELLNCYGCTLFMTGSYWYADRVLLAPAASRLWLVAGMGLTYIFFSLLGGKWAESWGPRRLVLRMGLLGILTASLGLAVVCWAPMRNMWGLLLALIAYNFTSTLMWPAMESAVSRAGGATGRGGLTLTTRMTIYNLIWSGASFGGLFTQGAVANLGWAWIYVIPAICMFGVVAIMLACTRQRPTETANHETPDEPNDETEQDSPDATARATRLLHMAWIANAMAYVAIQVLSPLMPTLSDKAGVGSLAAAGLLQSPWALLRFVGFIVVWRWTRWHYSVRWMLAAYLALAAGFAVMLLCPGHLAVFLAAQVIFGLATALLYCSSLYYAMHVSKGAGGHAGLHEALIGAGIAVGPMAGALAGTGSAVLPRIALAVSTVLAAGFIGLTLMGARAGKRKVAP